MDVIYELNDRHIETVHKLYQQSWWSTDRTLADTRKCIAHSQVCIGLLDDNGDLQAFTRILTDYTFKAIIFDLIVSAKQRGAGLGDQLMTLIMNHEDLTRVRHFELYCLPEMFAFYEKYGFSTGLGDIRLMRNDRS